MRKRFYAEDVLPRISDHVVRDVVFSNNGVRVWAAANMIGKTWFDVEMLGSDEDLETFSYLSDALSYAEQHQKIR